MLSLLVERDEIAKAQKALQNVMHDQFPEHVLRNISFRARVLEGQEVWTRDNYWYRRSHDANTPRFFNWFGLHQIDSAALPGL